MEVPIHYIGFSILQISTGASPNSLLRSVLKLGKENTNIKYQGRKSQPITQFPDLYQFIDPEFND